MEFRIILFLRMSATIKKIKKDRRRQKIKAKGEEEGKMRRRGKGRESRNSSDLIFIKNPYDSDSSRLIAYKRGGNKKAFYYLLFFFFP